MTTETYTPIRGYETLYEITESGQIRSWSPFTAMAYNLNNLFPKPAIYRNSPVADQRLTVDGTAGGVQLSAFADTTNMIVLDVQDADVMCTFDGSAPTSTNGHRLYSGSHYTWSTATASAAKFIRQGSTSAAIQASEFQL